MIDATESMVVFRGSKAEVLAGEIASQARTADELNDIMRLMMKAALKPVLPPMRSPSEKQFPISWFFNSRPPQPLGR